MTETMFFEGYDGPLPINPARVADVQASLDPGWSRVLFADATYTVVRGDPGSVSRVLKVPTAA